MEDTVITALAPHVPAILTAIFSSPLGLPLALLAAAVVWLAFQLRTKDTTIGKRDETILSLVGDMKHMVKNSQQNSTAAVAALQRIEPILVEVQRKLENKS